MRGSNFADSTSLSFLDLPAHTAELVDDSLTTLALNYQWRKIIAIALEFWFTHYRTTLGLENEDKFEALIQDLYTAENFVNRKVTTYQVDIVTNFSTTNLAGAPVTNSSVSHTFTYKNAIIRALNLGLTNSAAGGHTLAIVNVVGQAAIANGYFEMIGTARYEGSAVAAFENLPVGVAQTIRILLQPTSNQANMSSASYITYEIEEWD